MHRRPLVFSSLLLAIALLSPSLGSGASDTPDETAWVNGLPAKFIGEKAIEEGRRSYAARTAKSFFQVQSNPAFDTWVANGAFGSPQMVAEWLLPWFKIRKTVPSMSTLIVRFCSLDDVTQARRFHEEVMPLIRHAL